MPNFREIFEAYGADYQSTMERFMGNEKMYLKILDMLFEDKNLQKLGDALDSGDLSEAFEAAHTLKGVVGNMGLTPLMQAVCAVVEPLRIREPNADYSGLYRSILVEFQAVQKLREQLTGGKQL